MPSGFQDFFVVGATVYLQRDPVDSTEQPLVNLGVIQTIAPQISSEKIQLEDPSSGLRRVVDEQTTKFNEGYDLTLSNLNLEMWSYALLAKPPKDFTQTSTGYVVQHYGHNGRLVKVKLPSGDFAFALGKIAAALKAAPEGTASLKTTGQAVFASAKQFKVGGDITATCGAGDKFIVCGGGTLPQSIVGVYTVTAASYSSPDTTVTVSETVAADVSNVGAGSTVAWQTSANTLAKGTDWDEYSLDRGIAQLKGTLGGSSPLSGGAGNVWICFNQLSLSGKRLINPQDISGEIQGQAYIFLNRENDALSTVRECRISVAPNAANLPSDNYGSLVFTTKVLADTTKAEPAGRLIQIVGDLPNPS